MAAPEITQRARALLERSLMLDAHMDTLQAVLIDDIDVGQRHDQKFVYRADLPRFREAGFKAQVFAVWVDTIYLPHHAVRRALQQIDAFHRILDRHSSQIALARTGSDIRRIAGLGKLAALLSIEGGDAIESDLAVLRIYHRLGASSMTLTHSRTTAWCDSSTDAPQWNGLNDFGRQVIQEMNRLQMVIDVTHISDDAVRGVLEVSESPVIASHSSCRALSDHPRNLSDELLKAIAEGGGVVGINFYSEFLDQSYCDQMAELHRNLLVELNTPPEIAPEQMDEVAAHRLRTFCDGIDLPLPPFERILEHIDHVVQVAGVDHVGIGSDLDVPNLPATQGLDDVTDFPRITEGLLSRGYSEEDIAKIVGGNFVRVFTQVTEGTPA